MFTDLITCLSWHWKGLRKIFWRVFLITRPEVTNVYEVYFHSDPFSLFYYQTSLIDHCIFRQSFRIFPKMFQVATTNSAELAHETKTLLSKDGFTYFYM